MHVGPGECMQRSRGTIFIIKPRNVEMSNILLDYGWLVGAHIKKVMYQVSEEVFCSIICIHSCIFFLPAQEWTAEHRLYIQLRCQSNYSSVNLKPQ